MKTGILFVTRNITVNEFNLLVVIKHFLTILNGWWRYEIQSYSRDMRDMILTF